MTKPVGVVEDGGLWRTGTTVVGGNVGNMIGTHSLAELGGEVVDLPSCTVSHQRRASQQKGVPLGVGEAYWGLTGSGGEVENRQLGSTITSITGFDVWNVNRANVHTSALSEVVELP